MRKLSNKVAVVTGAGSGMGRTIAMLYDKEGAKVALSDLKPDIAQAAAGEIRANQGETIAVAADVSKEEDIRNLIDTALKSYGTLDILVNNAGIMDNFVPAAELTDELWDKVLAVITADGGGTAY